MDPWPLTWKTRLLPSSSFPSSSLPTLLCWSMWAHAWGPEVTLRCHFPGAFHLALVSLFLETIFNYACQAG